MKFNLSLDDMSPHSRAGLNFESINWCNKIIEKYPDFKVNLFIPSAFCRLGEKPNYLSAHPEWVIRVNNLPTNNYRVNLHGMFHRRTDGKHLPSNNDEFQYLTESETRSLILKIEGEFKKAGLNYYRTLRPPGWKISKAAEKVLVEMKYKIAGIKGVNWDLLTQPPQGDIFAYGHTSNWTKNYLNEERANVIMKVLDKQKYEFKFLEDI